MRLAVILFGLRTCASAAATLYVSLSCTNPVPPYANWETAATNIQDAVDVAIDGDRILVTNGVYRTGGRVVGGALTNRVAVTKAVVVESVNGYGVTVIEGYQQPGTVTGDTAIRCVYLTNGASLIGFTLTNGATRTGSYLENSGAGVYSTSVTASISNCFLIGNRANSAGGGASGGTLRNSFLIGNRSGMQGGGARGSDLYNCVVKSNLASGYQGGGVDWCSLYDCLLQGNYAPWGGGAWNSTLSNCLVSTNRAAFYGGGAKDSSLLRCTLIGNSVSNNGGGAYGSKLVNCSVIANSAGTWGGGALNCMLTNCTIVGNTSALNIGGTSGSYLINCIVYGNNGVNYNSGTFDHSCATPLPTSGIGNIAVDPLFVDATNGDYRLKSNSPCINAGGNAFVSMPHDLDGNPRIIAGTVDIGAYEFQTPASSLSYAWLQQYGLPTDGSADSLDLDADGYRNWEEWRCQTDPTNSISALHLVSAAPSGTNAVVSWQSVAGVNYMLSRSTNVDIPFTLLASNIIGQAGVTTYTDTNEATVSRQFYRVGVQSR